MASNIPESEKPRVLAAMKKNDTLCWSCSHAIRQVGKHECPWAWSFTPVRGWVAEPTKLYMNNICTDSFRVISCPMYECDGDEPAKPWSDDVRKDSHVRRMHLIDYVMTGQQPPTYHTRFKTEHCKNCKYFDCKTNRYKHISGICRYMNGNRKVVGSSTCVAFEEAEHDREM